MPFPAAAEPVRLDAFELHVVPGHPDLRTEDGLPVSQARCACPEPPAGAPLVLALQMSVPRAGFYCSHCRGLIVS